MRRSLRSLGVWPPVVTLVCVAVGVVLLFSDGQRAVLVRGEVPDAWRNGLALLRAGDPAAALAELAAAESQLGAAPPPLLRARLHAALRAGSWIDAEATAEKLALRAGGDALRHFVVGLAEYARGQRAGLVAEQPGADPTAFDRAIRHATAAALAFQAASLAAEGGDWPAARRNAERAAIRRTELQRKKEQSARERQGAQDQQRDEPDPEELEQIEQELELADDSGLLSAAELQALLQRVGEAEDEKRSLRRAARAERSVGVEQDW